MTKPSRKTAPRPAEQDLDPAVAKLTFEEAVEELEGIIERMERGETGLEESLKEYARGDMLIRRCQQILSAAEQRVQAIAGRELDAGQEPQDAPF